MPFPDQVFFIIDFDSTFIQVESLEELAAIVYKKHPQRAEKVGQVRTITDKAMSGEISFEDSLAQRVELLPACREDIEKLVKILGKKVSTSFIRNKDFLKQYADRVYILSSGFKEFIVPVTERFGISESHVFANTFKFDSNDKIVGYDRKNPLAGNAGKAQVLKKLNLQGEIYVIGDGYTDLEIKKAGMADHFYAFTENVRRESVVQQADHELPGLDELLFKFKLPASVSFPKNRIKVLLLENIHPVAVDLFKSEGYVVETVTAALDEQELSERVKDVSILGIRSKTQVSAKVLKNADKLLAVGAFCIGTNQIDLDTCGHLGIGVFNAPYSNTRSVVELAIAEMIMLIRRIPDKSSGMHQGIWDKSAVNSREIRGKRLGIIGYGNIGSQLSVLAEALGMEVYFYDVVDRLALGNARKCGSLKDVLKVCDVISLHVDGRPENGGLLGRKELNTMKDGAVLINLSRGHICDISALAQAIRSGKLGGLAMDVFPYEPKTNGEAFESELRGLPNVILTPHIGGSTLEAQENIAKFVPSKLMEYINTGNTYSSVNLPNLQLPEQRNVHRLIHIHKNIPGILAQINSLLAENQVNILGQYLKTNESIGYVITDIDKAYDPSITKKLKGIPNTIRFRVLY